MTTINEINTSLPIKNAFFHTHAFHQNNPIVLCDFDGTISEKDVTDTLLSHFGQAGCDELEEQWLAGEIGSQECMSKQIALLDANLDEVNQVLAELKIDPAFKTFVKIAQKQNIPVHIVSDGLDYAIRFILNRHGLGDLPIFANHLLYDNDRRWRLEFPYANKGCIKGSGNCKCRHVSQQKADHFNQILYVGDGTSDYCVSHKVDLVFAKDKLIHYCQENQINYCAIEGFADVAAALKSAQYSSLIPMMVIN
ncbi:MtnX-like HAD-IB family phosphatase [Orbaceae bacterium ESL0727]|nr:MtnX-like HAD-IB family phosphatase [Orbaceae bacterium ESL0727]